MCLQALDHPQINPIYYFEPDWLHLRPYIVLITYDHLNLTFVGSITDQYNLLDYMVLKCNCSLIVNICRSNYLA